MPKTITCTCGEKITLHYDWEHPCPNWFCGRIYDSKGVEIVGPEKEAILKENEVE